MTWQLSGGVQTMVLVIWIQCLPASSITSSTLPQERDKELKK